MKRYRILYKYGPDEQTDSLERVDYLLRIWLNSAIRVWDQVEDRDVSAERRIANELTRF